MVKRRILLILLVILGVGLLSSCNNTIPCPAYAGTEFVK